MKIFQPGEKYELIFSAHPRAGAVAGYVEIVSVDRILESEMQFRGSGIKENFDAHCGTISFIVHSESTWADEYCGGETEYEWFSPTKRSYYPISSKHESTI